MGPEFAMGDQVVVYVEGVIGKPAREEGKLVAVTPLGLCLEGPSFFPWEKVYRVDKGPPGQEARRAKS